MDMKTFAATHPAIRVDESSDWVRILRIERDRDIHDGAAYMTWGYTFRIARNTGEMRYTITDHLSVAPVGSLVIYQDDSGHERLRVEGRRGEIISPDVPKARQALDLLGEHAHYQDRAQS